MPSTADPAYDKGVFINCPFDDGYRPIFRAVVFAVIDSGFNARCALEANDSGTVRIDKIVKLIAECRFGIHDLSRTELDGEPPLPRFNMPFELGLFLAAKHFGGRKQKTKATLVMESVPYQFRRTLSDIAGQDVPSHGGIPARAIALVRDWLATASGEPAIPGGSHVAERYERFAASLPTMCRETKKTPDTLTFGDYVHLVEEWLRQTAP
jgi:hypothetical protein